MHDLGVRMNGWQCSLASSCDKTTLWVGLRCARMQTNSGVREALYQPQRFMRCGFWLLESYLIQSF